MQQQATLKEPFSTIRDDMSGYIKVPIENLDTQDGIGDFLWIGNDEEHGAILEFIEDINVDDSDVREFIRDNFKNYQAVLGFMRKVSE